MHELITTAYAKDKVTLVTLAGIDGDTSVLARVMTALASEGINVDMITRTPPFSKKVSVSFTIDDKDLPGALVIVGACQKKYPGLRTDVNSGNCKILLYGDRMVDTPGVGAWAFRTLGDIELKLVTTSDRDISILIAAHDAEEACRLFGIREYI